MSFLARTYNILMTKGHLSIAHTGKSCDEILEEIAQVGLLSCIPVYLSTKDPEEQKCFLCFFIKQIYNL